VIIFLKTNNEILKDGIRSTVKNILVLKRESNVYIRLHGSNCSIVDVSWEIRLLLLISDVALRC